MGRPPVVQNRNLREVRHDQSLIFSNHYRQPCFFRFNLDRVNTHSHVPGAQAESSLLVIALGGAIINFNLIALPMSEMVGGASYIGPYKTSDIAGLVIICLEICTGIFLMESLRITRLFPIIGSMDDRMRRTMFWTALSLLDTSGTYAAELKKAQLIVNYLLGVLQPGDSMAVGRIDTGSFSEKDIIAKVRFDVRPSVANNQKRVFQNKVNTFVTEVDRSGFTDISGGMLQAIEYLNESESGNKYILIFSDLQEELAKGYVRDVPFELSGFNIIALNVTKLRADNMDPKQYLDRVEQWREKTVGGGGSWRVINDLERLDSILAKG